MSKDNHEEWLKKYNKTKAGKVFELLSEIRSLKTQTNSCKSFDKMSYLASALFILADNTKYEEDIKEIITEIYPQFYEAT